MCQCHFKISVVVSDSSAQCFLVQSCFVSSHALEKKASCECTFCVLWPGILGNVLDLLGFYGAQILACWKTKLASHSIQSYCYILVLSFTCQDKKYWSFLLFFIVQFAKTCEILILNSIPSIISFFNPSLCYKR